MAISKITDNSLNITDLTIADDLTVTDDLLLASDSAVIKFGADAEITLTHSADSGLILKHAASGDDKFPILTLQTGDTDIAVNDSLGRIAFQAPDEGAGTDAILVAASIDAISEGDFSSSNNATTLDFQVGASAVARGAGDGARLRLTSAGELHLKPVSDTDGNYPIIHLQSPESVIETNDPLGEIQFSPPDEGSGTDAILVSASIQARAESAFGSGTNATSLDFKTASSEAASTKMTIDSSGIVTMPKQPCFRAQRQNASGGTQGFTTNITFNREILDLNADYDTSNGRFTAPVDGTYYFTHGGLGGSGSGGGVHTTAASWHLEFLKNGTRTGFQFYWYGANTSGGDTQNWYVNSYLDLIITLSAGDYITVQLPDGTDSYYSDTAAHLYEAFFQGFLIG